MNMFSQKRLLLPGMLLAFSLGISQAQPNNPFFIIGPEVICLFGCDTFSIGYSPGSGVTLPITVNWENGTTGNSTLFCSNFGAPGTYEIHATVTTANGQSFQVSTPLVVTWPCNSDQPIAITSNAEQLCAPNDLQPPPSGDFTLLLGNAGHAGPDQQVCLNVTTQNFTNIVGMQFSINYNPQLLQFNSVSNLANLPGFSVQGNFGLPVSAGPGMTSPGAITVSWADGTLSGASLPNGTTLFTLCFTGLAASGSTPVVFSGTPTPIQITNAALQSVPFNGLPGTVNFGSPPPPSQGLGLSIGSASSVAPGQQVCLSVTTQNFTDILSMQFSINYDPARLQFVSVGNFGLPGFSVQGNFGLPLPGGPGMTAPGNISVNWFVPDGGGFTLPDSSILFDICFIALPGGCSTEVVFSNTPAQIVILNGEEQVIPFFSRSGQVRFSGGSAGGNPTTNPACCEKVCAGATVQYRLNVDSTLIPPTWNVRGAESYTLIDNGFGVEVVWGSAGIATVSASMGNNFAELCVNILAVPEAKFQTDPPAAGDTLRVCRGQSVSFVNNTTGAAGFEWQFGDGSSASTLNPIHTFSEAGTYQVALIAWNECYCPDTAFVTVLVSPTLAPTVTCRGTVCEGTAVTYNTDADCGTFLWTVSPNGTVTAGGGPADNFISIDWHSGPEGLIQLQVDNCANADYCPEPNVMRVPVISESAQIAGPEQVCRGQSVRYAITPFGGSSFTWSVSSMGSIQSGQGTSEITVAWASQLSTPPQWVAVEYENCYLGCGGRDTIWVNIRPEFAVSGPVEVCLDGSDTYTARRSDTGVNVLCHWEVIAEDGTVAWASGAATAMPAIAWNFGTGRFRLIARPAVPADFCIPGYTIPVLVLAPPPALTGIAGSGDICPALSYTYEALGVLPAYTVSWIVGGHAGIAPTGGNPVNVTWGAASPYSLQARQVSPQGCVSPPVDLAAALLSAASITGASEVCVDESASYSATPFSQVEYDWSVSPAEAGAIYRVGNTHEVEILWHRPGVAAVNLSVCGQNLSLPVMVHPRPYPEVSAPAFLCAGETALVQTTSPFDSYAWANAAGTVLSDSALALIGAGFYQVAVTNSFSCRSHAIFDIESRPLPNLSLTTPDNAGICPGDPPSTLVATESDGGYTYSWYRDGSLIAGATASTYATTQLGVYQVEVVNAQGCSALSNTLTLFHYCAPGGGGGFPGGAPGGGAGGIGTCPLNTGITFDILPDPACNVSHYVNTSANFQPGSLLWNFGDPGSGANNTSTLENPSHTFSGAGYFRVQLSGIALTPTPEACIAIRVDTVPIAADFSYAPACAGAPVSFTDASTFLPGQAIASYSWNFGDPASGPANSSTDANPDHVYASPGAYTVSLIVTAANGCSSTFSRTVEVFGPPAMIFFDEPEALCAATVLFFEAQLSADVVEFIWNFGNPVSGDADSSRFTQPFHRYETPGVYTVALEAVNIYGCTGTFSRDITVEPNGLSGAVTFQSPICEGDSTLLAAPPGGTRWNWSTGETSESIWVRQAGVYAVTVTDVLGCVYAPPVAAVRVIPAPRAPIRAIQRNADGLPAAYVYDSLSVCLGEDVFLEVITSAGQTYMWSTGRPGPRVEFSETRNNRLPEGEHEIWVTVTETATGCVMVERFRIIVRPLPDAPAVSASPPGPNCEGAPVSFSVSNLQAGVSYAWNSGASGPNWTTARPGAWRVIATNAWGCSIAGAPQTILPGPDINLIPSGCHSRCRPDTLCFPNVPDVVSYQWFYNGAAQGPASGTVPQVVVTESGDYYMRMTTAQGCTLDSDPLTLDLFDGFGRIEGIVYWDRNNNGIFDPADSLLNNVPFILLSGNTPIDTVLSQSGGQYSFLNILAADYGLQLDTAALPLRLLADTLRVDTALVGCDVTLVLNWRLYCVQSTASLTLEACPGSTIDYNGTALSPGTTTDFTFANALGCDSIVTVTVNALPVSTASLTLQACPGSTVDYNGTALSPGTTMDFTFANALGCDSIVTVTVNALPVSTSSLTLQACPGSTVDYNGTALSPGTTTDFTFANALGCDSIVTVTVNALPVSTSSLTLQACPGSTVDYNGTALSPGTTMDFTLTNALGCDSIVTVTVNALPVSTASLTLQACPGSTIDYNSTALSPGTTMDFTFANALGCDSIVTVTVAEFPAAQIQATAEESCLGRATGRISASATGQGPFLYGLNGGAMQPAGQFSGLSPGAYNILVEDGNGCDWETPAQVGSLPPLQVDVGNTELPCNAESITIEARILSGDDGNLSLLWDDGSSSAQRLISAPGAYRLTAINGCDTLVQAVQVRYAGRPDLTPVYIPNAFSPNDDGTNDRFRGYASHEVELRDYELMVFDRWGNTMFHTRNIEEGWDGKHRDREMDPAVFVWWLRATVFHCGQLVELNKKGDVTLMR